MTGTTLDERRHVEAALAACAAGRFEDIAGTLVEERRRRGEEPWVLGALALIGREQGAYAQALEWADIAIQRGVDLAIGHAEAGLALSGLGRRRDAVPALARGLGEPLPHRATVALALAEAWFDEGDIDRAARLLSNEPWDEDTREDVAALAVACRTLRPDPAPAAAPPGDYGYRAGIRLLEAWKLGRRDLAERLSRRILRVAAEDADALGAVAILRMRQGRLHDADWLFGESLFREPRHAASITQYRAVLFGRLGRFAAIVDAVGGSAFGPLPPPIAALLGEALRRTGRPEEARAVAQAALSTDPGATLARVTLWRLAPDPAIALAEAEAAILAGPNDAALLFALAGMLRHAAPARAAALAVRALALDPLQPDAADWPPSTTTAASPAVAADPDTFSIAGLFAPKPDAGSAWPTKEQSQLLRIAFGEETDAAAAWALWSEVYDIRDLDAGSYRLMPLVLRRLLDAPTGAAIPHLELLRGIWRKAQVEAVDRLRRTMPAVDALLRAGIAVMPLKGLLLAHAVYPDVGSRPMSDLDLLVRNADARGAIAILEASGLRARKRLTPAMLHFHYAVTLREPSGGHVDLHWRPLQETVSDAWSEDVIWTEAKPVDILGRRLLRADWTFQLFHTAIHGTTWNQIAPVRWVADALMIIAAAGGSIDWRALDSIAARFGCRLALQQALRYLRDQFPKAASAIPAEAMDGGPIDQDEALLLPLRSKPLRSRCGPNEIAALCRRYAPLVARYDGALLAVVGGDPADAVRASCKAQGIPWFPTGEPAETSRSLQQNGVDVALCIDGESNGGYIVLARSDLGNSP